MSNNTSPKKPPTRSSALLDLEENKSVQSSLIITNKTQNKTNTNTNQTAPPPIKPAILGAKSLLARVEDFLPKMKEANAQLEKQIKEGNVQKVDIEHIDDETKPVIEMNLALGILEEKKELNEDNIVISTEGEVKKQRQQELQQWATLKTLQMHAGMDPIDIDSDSDSDSEDSNDSDHSELDNNNT